MSLIERINHYFLLILDTLKLAGLGRAWLILLAYFLVNWMLLYAHFDFMSPLFYGAVKLWTSTVNPGLAQVFTHYPQHFALMDYYFGWSKIIVGLLLEGLVLGLVARSFTRRVFRRGRGGESRSIWSLWFHLVIVWAVLNGLWFLLGSVVPSLAQPLLTSTKRILAFSFVALPGLFMVVFAVLYAALPAVVVYGDNALKAILRSIRLFLSRPFTSFFLAAAVLVVPSVLAALVSRPEEIINRFRPELIYYLLLAGLIVEVPAYFLWMGTAVHFLRDTED